MKRLLLLLLVISECTLAQGPISSMPTYVGNPNGGMVPVVITGANRKVDAKYFGYTKFDSVSTSFGGIYDTLSFWHFGIKSMSTLTRASGGGGSSAWADITGRPTTITGYGITDAFTQSLADARYSLLSHNHTFASLTSKPTTLSGYGITDAAALSHSHAAGDVTSGVFPTARLGTGTASSSTYLRGDGTWQTIAGGGTGDASTNTSSSADGELSLFSGTGGKTFRRATLSGLPLLSSGVLSSLAFGANGTYLKIVSGSPVFVNDSALIPTDGSMYYNNGVLGLSPAGASGILDKSVTVTSSSYTVASGVHVVICDNASGTTTITLPTTFPVDYVVTVKNFQPSNNVVSTPVRSSDGNTLVGNGGVTWQWSGTVWFGKSKY